ncbi:hypothetical protein E2C01_067669 [Portunus trituberculatus]|uniref:Uncharacterized protein n=1 Tax=Portunus trituberculatus TaxID=210409 RepID=A0A5B7HUE5_PORTR|nr:hypothetical protein [Portunus trituberculatus]
MGAPLRLAGFCVALWLTVMSRAEAQADSNLQVPDGTVRPFPTDGIRRYINGPTDTSIDSRMRFYSRLKDTTLESIGGRVEKDQNGKKWIVNGHSYNVADSTGSRVNTGPINGHTGGMRPMMGEVTREGLHHPYSALQNSDIAEQEQVSGSGGGQGEGESPDSNGTAGNKVSSKSESSKQDRAQGDAGWALLGAP